MQFERVSKEIRVERKIKKQRQWHLVFAFKPHRVGDTKVVWLERVYRRYVGNSYQRYEYKTRGDFITEALKTGNIK